MSERIRAMVEQHLIKEGHVPPFTEEQINLGRQSYLIKARAIKGGGTPSLDIPELVRLLELCRNRHAAETESKRSRDTFQILTFISPLDKKSQDLERTETQELMTGTFGKEDEREIFGLRFGSGVTRLVSGAAQQLLKGVIISLRRAASRRLDDAEQWLATSSLPNDPKFKLHTLMLQDADLAKKRENQLRALQNAATTEKARKTEKDDQMKQHDADVQRVEEAHRQRVPSLETPSGPDTRGDDDPFERAAKQMKMMMNNKAASKETASKDTRYINRQLCMEDLVFWLENDQHFRSTKVLLQMYLRLGVQKTAATATATPALAGEEILPSSSSKKRPLPS